jgi:peroxiredoxin
MTNGHQCRRPPSVRPLSIATAIGPVPTTSVSSSSIKKVALFAVPGAFTPTCSARHLPSYVDKAARLKAKGDRQRSSVLRSTMRS